MAEPTESELFKIVLNGTIPEKVRAVKLRITSEAVLEKAVISNQNVLEVIQAVFSRGSLSEAFLQRMFSKAKNVKVQELCVKHPNFTPSLLEDVLLDNGSSLKLKLIAARNKNIDYNGISAAIDPSQPEEVRVAGLKRVIADDNLFEQWLTNGSSLGGACLMLQQDDTTYLMQDRLIDIILAHPSKPVVYNFLFAVLEKKRDLALGVVRKIAEYFEVLNPNLNREAINFYYLEQIFKQQNVPADLLLQTLEHKEQAIVDIARQKLCG